jgi:anhydro-N-acetylmuramic acid kinase
MLRSRSKNRAALNIGGIANLTVLPKNCSINQVTAFDTGPGNMIIDGLMNRFYDKPFDNNGNIASNGKILSSLLRNLLNHRYFKIAPPKSTGRELFGREYISEILSFTKGCRKEDIIATVTEFTALSIYQQYLRFIRPKCKLDEIFASGGGSHNMYMMNALRRYFDHTLISTSEQLHIDPDAKEAVCFALLANETITGNPGNIPGATGSKKQTILGVICPP